MKSIFLCLLTRKVSDNGVCEVKGITNQELMHLISLPSGIAPFLDPLDVFQPSLNAVSDMLTCDNRFHSVLGSIDVGSHAVV